MKVGIDIIEVKRFEKMAKDENKLATLFTEKERKYFDKYTNKLEHIAGNFAAKEAVAKAFKTGFTKDIMPLDIEILHDQQGAPYVNLKNAIRQLFEQEGYTEIDVNISHSEINATAVCVLK